MKVARYEVPGNEKAMPSRQGRSKCLSFSLYRRLWAIRSYSSISAKVPAGQRNRKPQTVNRNTA
jgi:hypothetical protein